MPSSDTPRAASTPTSRCAARRPRPAPADAVALGARQREQGRLRSCGHHRVHQVEAQVDAEPVDAQPGVGVPVAGGLRGAGRRHRRGPARSRRPGRRPCRWDRWRRRSPRRRAAPRSTGRPGRTASGRVPRHATSTSVSSGRGDGGGGARRCTGRCPRAAARSRGGAGEVPAEAEPEVAPAGVDELADRGAVPAQVAVAVARAGRRRAARTGPRRSGRAWRPAGPRRGRRSGRRSPSGWTRSSAATASGQPGSDAGPRYTSATSGSRPPSGRLAARARRSRPARVGTGRAGTRSPRPPRRRVVEGQRGAAHAAAALGELGRVELDHLQAAVRSAAASRGAPRVIVTVRAVADQVEREPGGLVEADLDQVQAEAAQAPRLGSSSACGQ